jgi:hypothetical protein
MFIASVSVSILFLCIILEPVSPKFYLIETYDRAAPRSHPARRGNRNMHLKLVIFTNACFPYLEPKPAEN